MNPYDKLDFEMVYPPLANGGFICYGEYPNIQHNLKALEDVWNYSYDRVPYYGTNTPIDECYECGFTGEFECTSKGFTCRNVATTTVKKFLSPVVSAATSAARMPVRLMLENRKR